MSTGWGGGTSASRGTRGGGIRRTWDNEKRGEDQGRENRFWGSDPEAPRDTESRPSRGGSDFGAGRGRRRGQDGFRSGGGDFRGRGGDFRGRGRDFGRGGGGRGGSFGAEETQEELWERRSQQQAVQAERQSWLQVQNEQFPESQYLFGVSPVLAALRTKRRALHVLFIQETMEMDKRKNKEAVTEVEQLAEEVGCEVVRTDKGRLNVMSDNRLHQVTHAASAGGPARVLLERRCERCRPPCNIVAAICSPPTMIAHLFPSIGCSYICSPP
jgi:hypothetical protein